MLYSNSCSSFAITAVNVSPTAIAAFPFSPQPVKCFEDGDSSSATTMASTDIDDFFDFDDEELSICSTITTSTSNSNATEMNYPVKIQDSQAACNMPAVLGSFDHYYLQAVNFTLQRFGEVVANDSIIATAVDLIREAVFSDVNQVDSVIRRYTKKLNSLNQDLAFSSRKKDTYRHFLYACLLSFLTFNPTGTHIRNSASYQDFFVACSEIPSIRELEHIALSGAGRLSQAIEAKEELELLFQWYSHLTVASTYFRVKGLSTLLLRVLSMYEGSGDVIYRTGGGMSNSHTKYSKRTLLRKALIDQYIECDELDRNIHDIFYPSSNFSF